MRSWKHVKSTQNTFLIYCHGFRICQASCTFVATKVTYRLLRVGATSLLFRLAKYNLGNITSDIRCMKNTKTENAMIYDISKLKNSVD